MVEKRHEPSNWLMFWNWSRDRWLNALGSYVVAYAISFLFASTFAGVSENESVRGIVTAAYWPLIVAERLVPDLRP